MKGETKDYTHRPLVRHYLPWWKDFAKQHGMDYAIKVLNQGKTKFLTRKDEIGLIQALSQGS